MAFTTRAATAADHPTFARLFLELAVDDPVPGAAAFGERMLPTVLMVCDQERPVGYSFWQRYDATAHLVHLAIDPAARGRGAGRALMEATRARMLEAGCRRWYLNVKHDNHPAIRLYELCGLRMELEAYAMRFAWADLTRLPGGGDAEVFLPTPEHDPALAARFGLVRARIAHLRARGQVLVALRDRATPLGLAALDVTFPRAYPFRVARPELARALLEALRPHVRADRDFVHLVIEGDRPLKDALCAAGAQLAAELRQMEGALALDGGRATRVD